jgi:electron transfer flavoprotein-quinone oxidoreductase
MRGRRSCSRRPWTELVRDLSGKVIGVRTDRSGNPIMAPVVVLAEGVNGLVGQRSGLREELKPDTVALAVKEMHFLPREVIEARFNLQGNEGVVIEAMGTITKGMTGTGFLYTNEESISIGIGCIVEDFVDSAETPYGLLEAFKNHPSIKPCWRGAIRNMPRTSSPKAATGRSRSYMATAGWSWATPGNS